MQALGVIGLGTMGANLARNAARNGIRVSVFNRTQEKVETFLRAFGSEGKFVGYHSLSEFVNSLPMPRAILLMVSAGKAVDELIGSLLPLLSDGDLLIDGGNSHYRDTERRSIELSEKGICFIGLGVSGGEKGALEGPSMMPGGEDDALERMMPIFQKMAADDGDGGKCVAPIGNGGSGHFVKMVHNGIEYGHMQLIAEAYDLLRSVAGLSNDAIADLFAEWNERPELRSYLVEITAPILRQKDGKQSLIDLIKDAAGQKGTGKWTTEAAMEFGVSIPTINAAVDARILSGDGDLRAKARNILPDRSERVPIEKDFPEMVAGALALAMIAVYQQGFRLLERASEAQGWHLPFAEIARIWRGGCIIRSAYLALLSRTYRTGQVDATEIEWLGSDRQKAWRQIVSIGARSGVPLPAFSSALSFFDAVRSAHLPQNLIQAQRDFFGAHGFERTDRKGVQHGQW